MNAFIALCIGALFGAIVGSFLATLIIRWPQGRSVVMGRSACDHCGKTLAPVDLVPILSALLRRGKCRHCGAPIASLHFAVELGCAAIGGVAMLLAPGPELGPELGALGWPVPGWAVLGWAVLGWGLLTLAILDWRHFWLPDRLTLPLAFLGLTLGMWSTDVAIIDRVIGATAGYGVLLAIALGYRAVRGRDGLGLGDAKLLGAIGAWFGWQALPFVLLIASMLALLVVAITAMRRGGIDRQAHVPLGTYLCVAAVPGWLALLALAG